MSVHDEVPETYAVVDFPAPPAPEWPCGECGGAGVTGDRYAMATDGPVLLVDVFCAHCGGCGNDIDDHGSCDPALCLSFYDDAEAEEIDDGPDRCPSCQDRGWNAVNAYHEDLDEHLVNLRVPCGCRTDQVRLVTPTGDEP